MSQSPDEFERFVRALHRRLVIVRALEGAGVGALAGCAAGGLLTLLLAWRGQPALVPALIAIALGAAAGFAWGISNRPSRLAAATEADRQLGLADLLSTATTLGRGADRWVQTVAALADDRCRRHTPSQVLLARLGPRAWGAIASAAMLVLILAALPGTPGDARAASQITRPGAAGEALKLPPRNSPGGPPGRPSPAPTAPPPESRERDGAPGETPTHDPSADGSPPRTATSENQGSNASDDGTGGGAGRVNPSQRNSAPQDPLTAPDTRPSEPTGPATTGTSSSGAASAGGAKETNGAAASGKTSGPGLDQPPTPPWQSDAWPDDVRRAHDAVEAGRVPDAYRDLVREYFERR